nr:transmembrane emp24 domain-containing protein p24delta3-like [Ipomoea batatas]
METISTIKRMLHMVNLPLQQLSLVTTWHASGWMGIYQSKGATVGLDWKTGIFAKDWESVARKEKLEGVNIELMKLEGLVQAIHENLNYLKEREAEMREVSERTNARVAWFSIMSIGICIVVSLVQIWRLKTFFQKKKLI